MQKTTILIVTLLIFSFALSAQSINEIQLYSSVLNFDRIKDSEDMIEINKLTKEINASLEFLDNSMKKINENYPESKQVKSLTQNVSVLHRCLDMLKEDNNTWKLGYTLVKINLSELAPKLR